MATETGTQAIDRAAQLLVRVVEAARPVAVGELANSAGLPKSTTSRLVGALERQGLVQRIGGDRGRLRPGPVLQRFAHREAGAARLAAPVRGPGGDVVAALSISGPTTRLTPERLEGLAPLLLEQCAALARALGHHDDRGAA